VRLDLGERTYTDAAVIRLFRLVGEIAYKMTRNIPADRGSMTAPEEASVRQYNVNEVVAGKRILGVSTFSDSSLTACGIPVSICMAALMMAMWM
jgi:hypothetical protein